MKDMDTVYTIKFGGEAGFGVMAAGLTVSKLASRLGYHIFDYTEYPSLIRGGHNVIQTSISSQPVYAQYKKTDLLVALNQETLELHFAEVSKGGIVLYDSDYVSDISALAKQKDVHVVAMPLLSMIKEIEGSLIMRNTVALGAVAKLLGVSFEDMQQVIADGFEDKNEKVLQLNSKACKAGFDYIAQHFLAECQDILPKRSGARHYVLTGNEAISVAAISAGLGFAAIYPMTPTSNILHNLAPFQEKYGFIYKQPEDEISAINMAIGASHCGVRAMVATSGGGFCLMTEGYGLAGITETPLVIVEGMRGSPATGLPTWTEQGDLRFVLHAHQGDFPRIVLAAGDVQECFDLTFEAFNLADKYQTPVVLLVDKHVLESHLNVTEFGADSEKYQIHRGKIAEKKDLKYLRYSLTDDGISPRAFPGTGNLTIANSDEHEESGYSTEDASVRKAQMNKRMKKLETCASEDMSMPKIFGKPNAELTIVSWGSNKGAILEALKQLPNVNYVHLTWINPFPSQALHELLQSSRKILNIECNFSAQMHGLIQERTGIKIEHNLLKFDGRPIYPEEIIKAVKEIL